MSRPHSVVDMLTSHHPPAEAVMFVSQRLVKIICQIPLLFVCVRVCVRVFLNHYLKS